MKLRFKATVCRWIDGDGRRPGRVPLGKENQLMYYAPPPIRTGFNKRLFKLYLDLYHHRQSLFLMVRRDTLLRIKGTLLGPLWLLAQPLFLLLVYSFVFSGIMKISFRPDGGSGDFALYLFAALVPFSTLQDGLQRASSSLLENRDLLLKTQMPAIVFPAVAAIGTLVQELIGLFILIAAAWVMGYVPGVTLFLLPVMIGLRLLLTFALAPVVAILSVFVKDVGQVLPMLMLALFFTTPIIYPLEMIPADYRPIIESNPMTWLVQAYRSIILENQWPVDNLLVLAIACLVLLGVTGMLFMRLQHRAKDFL
ncbi:MAG: ABC transporter permease [Candidatus Thiodiazotropha sp. (ex Lucinoma kastoroae)]|nr:ABC transporter permease [Candidatus Thiodiazotropha sp. (ex Lucinoma kastoroae)]